MLHNASPHFECWMLQVLVGFEATNDYLQMDCDTLDVAKIVWRNVLHQISVPKLGCKEGIQVWPGMDV